MFAFFAVVIASCPLFPLTPVDPPQVHPAGEGVPSRADGDDSRSPALRPSPVRGRDHREELDSPDGDQEARQAVTVLHQTGAGER